MISAYRIQLPISNSQLHDSFSLPFFLPLVDVKTRQRWESAGKCKEPGESKATSIL